MEEAEELNLAAKLLQYYLDLVNQKAKPNLQLASMTVIQEFLKKDNHGGIKLIFMDNGFVDHLCMALDTGLENPSNLAFLDLSLKSMFFLSEVAIGPLQNMINPSVMRRLLSLLDTKSAFFNYSDHFKTKFQSMCINKNLVGKVSTVEMSSKVKGHVLNTSMGSLKSIMAVMPDHLKICSLYDTSNPEEDIEFSSEFISKHLAWPSNHISTFCEDKNLNDHNNEEVWEDIFVTDLIKGPLFWAHIGMSTVENVHSIQKLLATHFSEKSPRVLICKPDDCVLVKRTLDNQIPFYIRGIVLSTGASKSSIWSFDYGFTVVTPNCQIHHLPSHVSLDAYPPQISICSLTGKKTDL